MSPGRMDRKSVLKLNPLRQASGSPPASSPVLDSSTKSTGQDDIVENSLYHPDGHSPANGVEHSKIFFKQPTDDLGERDIFAKLAKTRVRYDVEVVTKLVVYAGTFWT